MPDEHEERELPTIREIEREIWRIAKSNKRGNGAIRELPLPNRTD